MTETMEKSKPKHVGKNLQRIRIYMGIKQETLAKELGLTQQAVSKIEQEEEIDKEVLARIGSLIGVTPEMIENFDEEKAIYNINNNHIMDNTFEQGSSAAPIGQIFNPIDKIVELYERLLKSEKEKLDLLKNK